MRTIILFLFFGSQLMSTQVKPARQKTDTLCAGAKNAGGCAGIIEKHQLPKYRDVVLRKNDNTILIKAKNGKTIELKNNSNTDADNHYYFRDVIKELNCLIFREQYFEGNAYCLVSIVNGQKYTIDAIPLLSPDKKRFVTCSVDIEAGYNPTRIQIWKASEERFVMEHSFEAATVSPRWMDNETIAFQDGKGSEKILKRADKKWNYN